MTLDLVLPPEPARTAGSTQPPRLVLVPPRAGTAAQRGFLAERDHLLVRAAVSGDRSTTALYLILQSHGAEPATTGADRTLCCVTCVRAGGAERVCYPCPTAEQALWALAATLP
jgi:hypothetical protein